MSQLAYEGCEPINRMPAGSDRTVDLVTSDNVSRHLSEGSSLIESICDLDIPDEEHARTLTLRAFASTTPLLIIQYRAPMVSSQELNGVVRDHGRHGSVVTRVHSGIVTARAAGPLGLITVKLRPDAAPRLLGDGQSVFDNCKIALADVVNRSAVSVLEDQLREAQSGSERLALVVEFVTDNARKRHPAPLIGHAARILRRNPGMRIQQLASEVGLSERHLLRRFRAIYGSSPKSFARRARLEKVPAARTPDMNWADLAAQCGFVDQAHLINDFRAVHGVSPQNALRVPPHELPETGKKANPTTIFYW
jgi:AraC-like DNA-binding protein